MTFGRTNVLKDRYAEYGDCPTCGAVARSPCLTTPARHALSYPHSARYSTFTGRVYNEAPPASTDPRMCPHDVDLSQAFCYECGDHKDQTVSGPYSMHERPKEQVFQVYGHKRRTGGQVCVGQFFYRMNATPAYMPMRHQAQLYADILTGRLNELNITVKDGRRA